MDDDIPALRKKNNTVGTPPPVVKLYVFPFVSIAENVGAGLPMSEWTIVK